MCVGSGKTFSMLGDESNHKNIALMGIIPRSISYIINEIAQSNEIKESAISVSFVEIYNETLKDLLDTKKVLKISSNRKGDTYIGNLTEKKVFTVIDVLQLIELANKMRTKAATKMNVTSSRSHMVMTVKLNLKYENDDGYVIKFGKINFADLAGSEKFRKTGIDIFLKYIVSQYMFLNIYQFIFIYGYIYRCNRTKTKRIK